MACIALGDGVHIIGGAIGSDNWRSIDWHLVYDPRTDRYSRRQPMPLGRDHAGIVVVGGVIPPDDVPTLLEMGAAAVFPPGTVIAEAAVDLLEKLAKQLGHGG